MRNRPKHTINGDVKGCSDAIRELLPLEAVEKVIYRCCEPIGENVLAHVGYTYAIILPITVLPSLNKLKKGSRVSFLRIGDEVKVLSS
ncbi:MAG TPA: hypothetical protein VJZ32_03900 [Candidatus Bathyarchaeia archaeon]|nr:hypothetical protein [Candidatus Bathyarchaeia archaeon]